MEWNRKMSDENALVEANKIHTLVEKMTPVKQIENSLASFLQDTFIMVREEDDYQKAIKAQVIANLPSMKNTELIALITSATTNKNDALSKTIAPIAQLLASAQQAEMAAKQKIESPAFQQTNIREVNNMAPGDVLVGLQSLFNLARVAQKQEDQVVVVPASQTDPDTP
jgi:hypothetical protein